MSGPYRLIQPNPTEPSSSVSFGRAVQQKPKRRRTGHKFACESCRIKKSACGGEKPKCAQCVARRVDCLYLPPASPQDARKRTELLEQEVEEHEEFFERLATIPESDALEALRRLRSTRDRSGVFASLRDYQPTEHQVLQAMMPAAPSGLEFELNIRHQMVYPTLFPFDTSSIRLSPILKPKNGSPPLDDLRLSWDLAHPPQIADSDALPLHRSYCDHRLARLSLSFWTDVVIDDSYAANVISSFLEIEHPVLGLVDADLFLTDLVEHRTRFCSKFLVNSFLYHACQGYAAVSLEASALSVKFYHESKRLWKAQSSDSIMTLAAIMYFGIGCFADGVDDLGIELIDQARAMAERMQLLGADTDLSKWERLQPLELKATAHTAWGAYIWLSFHANYYQGGVIQAPPALPIPGDASEQADGLHGLLRPLPEYMGKTFPSACKFWAMAQEVSGVYSGDVDNDTSRAESVPLSFAEARYSRLLSWANSLPLEMARGYRRTPDVILFHLCFHGAVLDLFRPYLDLETQLTSFSSPNATPAAIFNASLSQLKHLALICRFQFPHTLRSIFVSTSLLHISNAMLRLHDDPERRFYYELCLCGYLDLYVCYPAFESVMKGFLTLGIRHGILAPDEARRMLKGLRKRGKHHKNAREEAVVGSSLTIDFERARTAPEEARAAELAKRFEDLAMFEEFTSGEYNFGYES